MFETGFRSDLVSWKSIPKSAAIDWNYWLIISWCFEINLMMKRIRLIVVFTDFRWLKSNWFSPESVQWLRELFSRTRTRTRTQNKNSLEIKLFPTTGRGLFILIDGEQRGRWCHRKKAAVMIRLLSCALISSKVSQIRRNIQNLQIIIITSGQEPGAAIFLYLRPVSCRRTGRRR